MADRVTECGVLIMQLETTSERTTFGGEKKQAIKKKEKKGKL